VSGHGDQILDFRFWIKFFQSKIQNPKSKIDWLWDLSNLRSNAETHIQQFI
jgi:hypothetical protein